MSHTLVEHKPSRICSHIQCHTNISQYVLITANSHQQALKLISVTALIWVLKESDKDPTKYSRRQYFMLGMPHYIFYQLIEKLWETNTHHICSTEQHFHPAFKGETSGREQRKGPRPKRHRPTRGARSALGRSWGISILLFIFPFIVLDFTLLCQCEIVPRRRVVRYLGQCTPSRSITFLLLSAASQRRFRKALVGKPEKSDSDTARAQTLPRSCDQISLQVPTEHLVDEKYMSKRKARTRATY
ncbi:Hypothetical_protein [Hexamita inflata]|uniref:Hypothetical_protein n=1 Tax=Hexamita inflata TaxID=28002 RepID=A0AA86NMR8_9EUKA|nr:Hypothetical protein HINF_LOCUS9503 [Hexamita inflata]